MIKLLAIVGPTAVGKTDLSIKLAQKFNAEIISGDSMQVYRHLDIGTAKITPEEMAGGKHHLIDVRNIDERFSVADFVQDASKLIEAIHEAGKLPIIVGGTGFYLQALLSGLELGGDQYQNDDLRRQLLAEAKEKGDSVICSCLWLKVYYSPGDSATISYRQIRCSFDTSKAFGMPPNFLKEIFQTACKTPAQIS